MTKRLINLGIINALGLALTFASFGIYSSHTYITFDDKVLAWFVVLKTWFYVSVLWLVQRIFIHIERIRILLKWIIRFELFIGVARIAFHAGVSEPALFSFFSVVALLFYGLLFVQIHKKAVKLEIAIKWLRAAMISSLALALLQLALAMELREPDSMEYYIWLIPIGFIMVYFIKVRQSLNQRIL